MCTTVPSRENTIKIYFSGIKRLCANRPQVCLFFTQTAKKKQATHVVLSFGLAEIVVLCAAAVLFNLVGNLSWLFSVSTFHISPRNEPEPGPTQTRFLLSINILCLI